MQVVYPPLGWSPLSSFIWSPSGDTRGPSVSSFLNYLICPILQFEANKQQINSFHCCVYLIAILIFDDLFCCHCHCSCYCVSQQLQEREEVASRDHHRAKPTTTPVHRNKYNATKLLSNVVCTCRECPVNFMRENTRRVYPIISFKLLTMHKLVHEQPDCITFISSNQLGIEM